MARIGVNPARRKTMTYHPQRVTVAVMVYIPNHEGYFKNRFDIFRICLASLRANTTVPYDLLVLANGCCEDVVEALRGFQKNGMIDTLIVSRENLGVIGGYKQIFGAAQGEIVAYCDDDVLFYPNWLEEQLKLLDTFMPVGMVSGVPVRDGALHAGMTLLKAEQDGMPGVTFTRDRRIPDEWEIDWCQSTGRDPQSYLIATGDLKELVLSKDGVEAIGSANHFQFVAPRRVILSALPEKWSPNLMDSLVPLEEVVDNLGYLRLSTMGRYCRHMGNSITAKLAEEIGYLNLDIQSKVSLKAQRKHWLLYVPGMGRILWRIYDTLFRILNRVN